MTFTQWAFKLNLRVTYFYEALTITANVSGYTFGYIIEKELVYALCDTGMVSIRPHVQGYELAAGGKVDMNSKVCSAMYDFAAVLTVNHYRLNRLRVMHQAGMLEDKVDKGLLDIIAGT